MLMKHLTGIDHLSKDDIEALLNKADTPFKTDSLKGKVILSLFFENSTRTKISFDMAAKRLGAEMIHWDAGTSSISKGETFLDTILNLNAMKPDAVIVRHHEYGAPQFMAQHMDCPVINAGDSYREHPTQALLDALTMRQAKGKLEDLNIAICGDIAHSRVAHSNMILLDKMKVNVRIVAPPALMPDKLPVKHVQRFDNLKEGLKDCDIIMMLRNQKERMESGLIASDAEFFNHYGLTLERLAYAKPDCLVMHPGPMNRNVEIADEVADDPQRSLILKQVENGVLMRMAVLESLLSQK
jgi:aspartate carbamoyltransferase catalytic subunit